ncbi:hypothetical protein TruAng_008638 [Truncatella angustata]|nr:hypothetical protein TruAng_008638 [Truncatella angustata]
MTSPTANGDSPVVGTDSPPPASRSQSISLQAAATMNAGLQRRSSNSSVSRQQPSPAGRRRSTVLMNIQHNDPSLPPAGEIQEGSGAPAGAALIASSPRPMSGSPLLMATRDPYHNRTPSLGELHQELEAEQEAQVNRLLHQIRRQQVELQQLHAAQDQNQTAVAADDATPTSERSRSASIVIPSAGVAQASSSVSTPRSPVLPRGSFDIAQTSLRPSRTPSRSLSRQTSSSRMRSGSISAGDSGDPSLLSGRDETAFYQAETQSLVRENQMLRHRIRELERQLTDAQTASSVTREPAQPSHLLQSQSVSEDESGTSRPSATTMGPPKAE